MFQSMSIESLEHKNTTKNCSYNSIFLFGIKYILIQAEQALTVLFYSDSLRGQLITTYS